MDVNERVMEMDFFKFSKRTFKVLSDDECALLTCSIGLLVHLAAADRIIKKEEVSYMKRFLKKATSLESKLISDYIRFVLIAFKEKKMSDKMIGLFESYLHNNLSNKQKEDFLEVLFSMAKADDDISKVEREIIKEYAFKIGIDNKDYAQHLMDNAVELMKERDSEIAADDELGTHDDELEFISMADYSEQINKRYAKK